MNIPFLTTKTPKQLSVMFLGAAKRLSLLEAFDRAADNLDIELNMFSLEASKQVPIARLATILEGPGFRDRDAFRACLSEIIPENGIEIVIPLMDSATVALSELSTLLLTRMNCHALVSSHELCKTMEDKVLAEQWFYEHGIPTPDIGKTYPIIIKSRLGFGSRDQVVVHNVREHCAFYARHDTEDYIEQSFVPGQEYTVDAFVSNYGALKSVVTRTRIEVEAGESMVTETHRHQGIIDLTTKIFKAGRGGFVGPLTFQFIDGPDGPVCIECNPRFGGGVIASFAVGQDMPRWILEEYLFGEASRAPEWKDGVRMTRARREVFFDDGVLTPCL